MRDFWLSDAVLVSVQALLVCGPRPPLPAPLRRLGGGAWALVLPLSLGTTIALLAALPGAAPFYTWLALVAIPILAAIALSPLLRWRLAVGVTTVLFVAAWSAQHRLVGQGAAVTLTALSCSTLASYLRALAPRRLLQAGVLAMAALDAILVFGQLLQGPNDSLNAAAPAAGLPQLQVAVFCHALIGYGDFFVAAVLGTIVGLRQTRRVQAAVVTLVLSGLFDLLFLVVHTLPATVPVAAAMLVMGLVPDRSKGAGVPSTATT